MVRFGLKDEEYLREKWLNTSCLKELLVFGLHMDHLWFPKFKSLWASQTMHTYNYTQERKTHKHTHKPWPPPSFERGTYPLQAGSIHRACICLIRAISMVETRRGNLSNPAVKTYRHKEGARNRSWHLCVFSDTMINDRSQNDDTCKHVVSTAFNAKLHLNTAAPFFIYIRVGSQQTNYNIWGLNRCD